MRSVWSKTLFDRRWAMIGWLIGFVFLAISIISIYPSVRDSPELDQLMERLPDALKAFIGERSLTSPVGYVQSRLFQLIVPLLMLVLAIGQGADSIAGEEQRKTMDLLLANPISRKRILVEKFLAMVVQLAVLGVVLLLSLVVLTSIFDVDLAISSLAAACTNAVAFALAFGAAAVAIGAGTGHKAAAVGVVTALAAAAYVWESLAAVVPALQDLAWLSPFHHYADSDPLVRGFSPLFLSSSLVAAVGLVAVGMNAFSRRDVKS